MSNHGDIYTSAKMLWKYNELCKQHNFCLDRARPAPAFPKATPAPHPHMFFKLNPPPPHTHHLSIAGTHSGPHPPAARTHAVLCYIHFPPSSYCDITDHNGSTEGFPCLWCIWLQLNTAGITKPYTTVAYFTISPMQID